MSQPALTLSHPVTGFHEEFVQPISDFIAINFRPLVIERGLSKLELTNFFAIFARELLEKVGARLHTFAMLTLTNGKKGS